MAIIAALALILKPLFATKWFKDESDVVSPKQSAKESPVSDTPSEQRPLWAKLFGAPTPKKPLDEWTEEELRREIECDEAWLAFWGEQKLTRVWVNICKEQLRRVEQKEKIT